MPVTIDTWVILHIAFSAAVSGWQSSCFIRFD